MEYTNLEFEDDLLNRKTFVVNLMQVINKWDLLKHENDSLVISVDAAWGSGKSYLLNMWKNWLLSEENSHINYGVAYYNAWENDDCDNAFIPLVYKLQQMDVNKENITLLNNVTSRSKSFLKSCAVALLKDGIKKAIGDETADLICEGIDGVTEKEVESFFEQYGKFIDEKEKFRKALYDLIPDNGKLIVFVDELDRCRPTFAVDLEQLSHSISTMYGDGMDSAGYLRRFFDVNINIPSGDIKQYVLIILSDHLNKMGYAENFIDIVTNLFIKLKLSLAGYR